MWYQESGVHEQTEEQDLSPCCHKFPDFPGSGQLDCAGWVRRSRWKLRRWWHANDQFCRCDLHPRFHYYCPDKYLRCDSARDRRLQLGGDMDGYGWDSDKRRGFYPKRTGDGHCDCHVNRRPDQFWSGIDYCFCCSFNLFSHRGLLIDGGSCKSIDRVHRDGAGHGYIRRERQLESYGRHHCDDRRRYGNFHRARFSGIGDDHCHLNLRRNEIGNDDCECNCCSAFGQF